ncbi:MAG: HAMP domain-containing histidine kinase [Marinifilaceae bacterium]|jgi:nitrogen fixation/metabolism regulation signal transduction histidine kinase|nr:HAMP domain-containing histidine kinase [Marinifilaceae bacterium]
MIVISLFVLLVVQFISIFKLFNSVNRKLTYFFDAVKNEDTSLILPESTSNKSLRNLHKSMNYVNSLISDIKMKNASNERFLHELINHSTTGLLSIDEHGYVQIINNTAKDYLRISSHVNIKSLKRNNIDLYNVIENLKPGERSTVKISLNNKLEYFVIQNSVLKFHDKIYKLYSIHDIKKELDEKEIESYQKLIRVMTHEIMNSIAPITSLSQTLNRLLTKDGKKKSISDLNESIISNTVDGLSIIQEQGIGLTNFVDNYRKMTKLPEAKLKDINIKNWINSVFILYQSEMEAQNILFEINNNSYIESIFSDEHLLNQVLINLIKNAMHAVKNSPKKHIYINLSSFSNKFDISVNDTGVGIDSEYLEKIFIPFFTTKEEGDGIGLSLSREIIKKLNGQLNISSKLNKGSSFSISLYNF